MRGSQRPYMGKSMSRMCDVTCVRPSALFRASAWLSLSALLGCDWSADAQTIQAFRISGSKPYCTGCVRPVWDCGNAPEAPDESGKPFGELERDRPV